MDEQKKPRRTDELKRTIPLRLLAIGFVLYMLADIVFAYLKGGPEAPNLTLLLLAIAVLGGGAALVGWLTWSHWKAAKKADEENEE